MHRCHDYKRLLARWRRLAGTHGLRVKTFATAGKHPIVVLRSPALSATGGIFLSAGIHGDEPGATEGLITWAETQGRSLREIPLMIFPCLNPWGLINNIRLDEEGHDLNRSFHRDELPLIREMKREVGVTQFELAVMLHEDYDGQGVYLYEIQRRKPSWGAGLLAAASAIIPIEPRRTVDHSRALQGLIRRRVDQAWLEEFGYPEAIWLHQWHSQRTFTIETPSEFALEDRVRAHGAMLDECVRRVTDAPPQIARPGSAVSANKQRRA